MSGTIRKSQAWAHSYRQIYTLVENMNNYDNRQYNRQ